MPPHPQVQALLDQMAAATASRIGPVTVADMRAGMVAMIPLANSPEVGAVEDLEVPTSRGPVPVRLYRPPAPGDIPLPLLLWLHGGGFVGGDLRTADPTARDLCVQGAALVASVDYPLAPEHPFPAAPEACAEVSAWLVDHAPSIGADPERVAIGGDSAGGNLAAVCAQSARRAGRPAFSMQLLVYPVTDFLGSHPSVQENAQGYLLTSDTMAWIAERYLPGGVDPREPLVSPLYAPDLSGLPPAYIVTAELDPLRDEGEAYGRALEQAGVAVDVIRYDGMVHGFFAMTAVLDVARQALSAAARALQAAWASPVSP